MRPWLGCVLFAALSLSLVAHADPGVDEELADIAARVVDSPGDANLRIRYADLLRRSGRQDAALAELAIVETLAPRDARTWIVRGRIELDRNRLEAARRSAEAALSLAPDDADAHILRGRALARSADFAGAVSEFDEALALRDDLEVSVERGRFLVLLGRFDEAADGYRAALIAHSGAAVLRRALVDVELMRGDHLAALAEIDAVVAHARIRTDWLLLRAEILAALGRDREAEADRASALEDAERLLTRRSSPSALASRADALLALGRVDEAIHDYEQALRRAPQLEAAREGLARARRPR